ncbi:hypothetical protein ERJ75_001009800 [Trypanosoma vivax]|uniref:F-box domain-containing protein n=1 Tax=Trypanosoma vivax (strain Y486) TaxID=1055687 RepID=G0TYM7_TRYVY|nr:hypothetical protein TRVL_02909 [Trypanosoma vivax]KAH8611900.1 hypothetical protein ERJ75_001009800 [Trypanosoma vivax]CCC49074.1 conserved hypothetical protein [Trypanosoma vivax Y486]
MRRCSIAHVFLSCGVVTLSQASSVRNRPTRPLPLFFVSQSICQRGCASSHVPKINKEQVAQFERKAAVLAQETGGEGPLRLSPLELLFRIVSPLIASAPCVTRVQHVYTNIHRDFNEIVECQMILPPDTATDTHRWLRNQFGTLGAALKRLQAANATEHWGIYVSSDGMYSTKAHCDEEAAEAFMVAIGKSKGGSGAAGRERHPQSGYPSVEGESLLEVFQPVFPNFTPPRPPQNMESKGIKCDKRKGQVPEGIFTPQMLVPHIPTFFIPFTELVKDLPEGYTADHVERLFSVTETLEIVTLEGEKFVRLHGGKCSLDFRCGNAGAAAHERWRAYKPNPFLCESFRRLLPPVPKWVSLRALISHAPASLVEALLPWKHYKTILFFAQMQHVFSFTPAGEGEVCWAAPVNCLSYHDSPTPEVVSELAMLLSGQRVYIADLQNPEYVSKAAGTLGMRISDHAKMQIIMYYGTLLSFFRTHGDVFIVDDDMLVSLVSDQKTTCSGTYTLEDQLEKALVKKDRRTAQKTRRRIARDRNPDSPYVDKGVLLDAILRYVPRQRSISLNFLLKALPPALSDFLPERPITLFQRAPEKVQLFEHRYRHRLRVIRTGVPLPLGALRQTYTEEELLFLCATELQQPRYTADLYGRLPYGAKETIRLKYKGLLELLRQYPQYFVLVFKDALRLDTRQVQVTLLQMPPHAQLTEDDYGITVTDEVVLQQLDAEDKEAVKTLPEEIKETLNPKLVD